MKDLFETPRKFAVYRDQTVARVLGRSSAFWVWRLNYPNPKTGIVSDRCVAGPFETEQAAQTAINEGRITCL